MTPSDPSEESDSGRIVREPVPGGVRFRFPPPGLSWAEKRLRPWFLLWGVSAFVVPPILAREADWVGFLVGAVVFGTSGLGLVVRAAGLAWRRPTITAANGQLVFAAGGWPARRQRWERDQITAIRVGYGLCVLTYWRMTYLPLRGTPAAMDWVARTLRQVLDIPDWSAEEMLDEVLMTSPGDSLSAGAPGEVRVAISGDHINGVLPGCIHVRPGELAVRNAAGPYPNVRFCPSTPASLLRYWLDRHVLGAGVPIPLAPHEVTLRVDANDRACIQIAQRGGKYLLCVWLGNKTMGQALLARFWGATDE